MNSEQIIKELNRFSKSIITLGGSISDNRIELFELKYNLKLPQDFKLFMSKINGLNLMGNEVYPFDVSKPNSIENVYQFEHFEIMYPQYLHLVPFSNDGRGNFYCIDTSESAELQNCNIVFWTSNYEYSTHDSPETTHTSFIEWVKEIIIDWTLEDYNYDGSEKLLEL